MQDFILAKREEIAELCRRHHVRRLSIFGSAARDDFDSARSDVDLLVQFEALPPGGCADAYFGLRESLEDLLGRDVDLVALSAVRNPYMKADIERTRTLLYAA